MSASLQSRLNTVTTSEIMIKAALRELYLMHRLEVDPTPVESEVIARIENALGEIDCHLETISEWAVVLENRLSMEQGE